jgi:hypothetical protein
MQYGMDFTEAQRRWDAQFAYTQQQDAASQALAGRQQTMAEWVANAGQQNWREQFGLQSLQNQQQYGLAQQAQAEQIRSALASEGLKGRELDLAVQTEMNRHNQFYSQQAQQANQFNQTFGLDALQNQQQYDLARQAQALQAELGRAGVDQAQQKIIMDDWMNKQTVKLQQQQLGQQTVQDQRQYDLSRQAQALQAELGRAGVDQAQQKIIMDDWMNKQTVMLQQQQLGQENELTRWRTGQELGFSREQLQAETAYKYANLQQQAQQFAAEHGLNAEQVRNTRWYQEQQTAIEREQLAQQYKLQTRGYDIQAAGQAQEGAIARERMVQDERMQQAALAQQREAAAYAAFGRAQNPNTRWLRAS